MIPQFKLCCQMRNGHGKVITSILRLQLVITCTLQVLSVYSRHALARFASARLFEHTCSNQTRVFAWQDLMKLPKYVWVIESDAFFTGSVRDFVQHYMLDTADYIGKYQTRSPGKCVKLWRPNPLYQPCSAASLKSHSCILMVYSFLTSSIVGLFN